MEKSMIAHPYFSAIIIVIKHAEAFQTPVVLN